MEKVLEVKDLNTNFYTDEGVIKAVDGLSYHINKGECVGLVGESGCGKSVSALSILRLIPYPPGVIEGGEILFKGENLLEVSEKRIQEVRGDRISMIFQEPSTSLNPVLSAQRQLTEMLELHRGMTSKEAKAESVRLLEMVGIPDPERRVKDYPHQFSGGMQQRIMIAIALSCSPDLIIADEPTTSLDVTVQAQILEILADMRERLGTAVLIITHNLGVVARYVERLNVMYAGSLVETGPTDVIFAEPKHPYTIGLLRSVPRLDKPRTEVTEVIEGVPPNLAHLPAGCPFAERCRFVMAQCREEKPVLEEVSEGHFRACFYDADKLS
jgi:oligopeptide transport system ATP-binding protein